MFKFIISTALMVAVLLVLLMAIAALVVGLAGNVLSAMAISDPLRQLSWALGEVQRGNYNAHMQIYDATELGLLQAGFNDMVRGMRVVTPAGVIDLGRAPASAAGPDLRELFAGSEGVFGVITRVRLRVHPVPEASRYEAWSFPD